MQSFIRSRRLLAILGVIIFLALVLLLMVLLVRNDSGSVPPGSTKAVKIEVIESGLYRITSKQLRDAGFEFDPSDDDDELSLTTAGVQVPYRVQDEAIIFYGLASDSRYSAFRPYVLTLQEIGLAMEVEQAVPPSGPTANTIGRLLRLEENVIYDSRAMQPEPSYPEFLDPWFWAVIQHDDQLSIEFEVESTDDNSGTLIRTALSGATSIVSIDPDHDLTLELNGARIGTLTWDGEEHHIGELAVDPGILRAGKNTLVFDNSVGSFQESSADSSEIPSIDIVRLDWIEVEYFGPSQAADDVVQVKGQDGAVLIEGFSGPARLFDVSDPSVPVQLSGADLNDDSLNWQMSGTASYLAAAEKGYVNDPVIKPMLSSNLREPSNQADLLILTTAELSPVLESLIDWRESQGLSVKIVTVEEAYDEFGYGDESPQAITEFIRFALSEWQEPYPRYLLIVGDASYDYRDYLELGTPNLIPSPMVGVSFGGETVSDANLGDINDDGWPDLAIGRWPVREKDEVQSLVRRTIDYEQGSAATSILLAADGTSEEFSSLNDEVYKASDLPEESAVRLYGVPSTSLVEAWNSGAWLVSYAGHGSIDRWGKDDVFSAGAVPNLDSEGSPPIVLQMTCLTGFYAHPTADSISELLLRHEDGPVEIIAATSLTLSSSQMPFGINFLKELQDPENIRIGDALQEAKLQLDVENSRAMREISETFILLGDPSAIIVRPEQ